MTNAEAIKEIKDASDSEVRYGDIDNHYDEVMKRVEAFEMAIKALAQQSRDCNSCKHSDNGNCAYTEECHECMWESKYEQQPSDDCISREAVIKHICESKECYKDECKGRLYKRCFDLQWIYDLPSVTPTRPKGKWIDDSKEDSYYANCSHCNYQIDTHYERGYLNYCPNCGAKMEVNADEDSD